MDAPVEISWDFDLPEGGPAAETGGQVTGMDAPVEISWDFDVSEAEPAAAAAEASGISWDVAPDAAAPEGAGQDLAEGVAEGTEAVVDIDWDVQMEGIEVADAGAADPAAAAIDWDISPQDVADAAPAAPSEEGAVERGQVAPAPQDSVIAALIANSDIRNRCAAKQPLPALPWGLPAPQICHSDLAGSLGAFRLQQQVHSRGPRRTLLRRS